MFFRTFREDYFRPISHVFSVLHGFRNVVSFNPIAWNYIKLNQSQSDFCFTLIREMRSRTKKIMCALTVCVYVCARVKLCVKCWVKKNCGNFSRHLSYFRILKQCSNRTSDTDSQEMSRAKKREHECTDVLQSLMCDLMLPFVYGNWMLCAWHGECTKRKRKRQNNKPKIQFINGIKTIWSDKHIYMNMKI